MNVIAPNCATLRELIESNDRRYEERFIAQERGMKDALAAAEKQAALAMAAAEKAVSKAEIASEKRFDSVNEFRGQLKDQTATFITRAEAWGYLIGLSGILFALMKYGGKAAP
jgi:hypothetical protein